jgi:hypothetical protein
MPDDDSTIPARPIKLTRPPPRSRPVMLFDKNGVPVPEEATPDITRFALSKLPGED